MALITAFTKQLAAASSNGIATSQSGTANTPLTLTSATVTIDTATAANVAVGRRVVVAYSGSDCNWTVVGTNSTGNAITDTIVGSSGAGQSNLDFVTVSSVTPAGNVTGATAGTNGVGSSPWTAFNWSGYAPMNIGFAVEVVSGSANFTIQHTYDDPNNLPAGVLFPLAFNDLVVTGQTATVDSASTTPITALRLLINSGTGELRTRFLQAGAG